MKKVYFNAGASLGKLNRVSKRQFSTRQNPMKNSIALKFLQNDVDLHSAPDEEHHEIVLFFDEGEDCPVTLCQLPLSTCCEEVDPDDNGGARVGRCYHVDPKTMIRLGQIMGHSVEMLEALNDLQSLAQSAAREGLDTRELAATMLARITKALPNFNTPT